MAGNRNKESTGFLLLRRLPLPPPEPAATADARRLAFHAPRAPLSASNPRTSITKQKPALNDRPVLVLWRGRRNRKTTGLKSPPVQKPKKAYILPAFSLSWPIAWGHITNGERVVIESINQCHQKTTDLEVQKFKSRRPLESMTALKPPAIKYAHS